MSAPHFGAVRELLTAVVPATVRIHDTDASAIAGKPTAYPYIVLSGGVPLPEHEALGACATGARGTVRVTHVALAPGAVREMVASSRAALDGAYLPLPGGLELELIDHLGVTPDREVAVIHGTSTSWPYYAVDVYRTRSTA